MTKFADKAISHLISLGCVSESERDIYVYGFLLLSSLAINLLVTIVIGFAFGMPLAIMVMFLSFSAVRAVSGGYHAESFGRCVAVSAISMGGAIATIKFTPSFARYFITAIMLMLSLVIVFIHAPVGHPNRALDVAEIIKFRKLSRITVISTSLISVVLFLMRATLYGFSISIGIALSGAATLLAALKNHGGEYDDEKV
jgi:accessory gene regulator B